MAGWRAGWLVAGHLEGGKKPKLNGPKFSGGAKKTNLTGPKFSGGAKKTNSKDQV